MAPASLPAVYIFIAWVVFLVLLIAAIMIYRWRLPHRYSRFQLKLTLALILFLLIPTVPLVYVAGTVVDQARGLVVALPLDEALESGVSAVRLALEDPEARMAAWRAVQEGQAPSRQRRLAPPDFTEQYEKDTDGAWQLTAFVAGPRMAEAEAGSLAAAPPDVRSANVQVLGDAGFFGNERTFFLHGNKGVYMELVAGGAQDTVRAAGIWIDSQLVEARNALDQGLKNFHRITMLAGRGFQETLWTVASLWLVILTAGAFIISRLLAGGVSGPVLELARGMETVASGDLTVKLDVPAKDEMKVLQDSFTAMTGQLRDARMRIVTAEKQAAWRDVARRIAHEIKNPLTPLQIGLHRVRSRLEKEDLWGEDDDLRESLLTMNEEVDALRRMAASFSEFAQLPQPEMRPADLEEVVRNAAALFQEGSPRAHLRVEVRGHIPRLQMDTGLIKRAVINLVKNAVESAEEAGGGDVNLTLEVVDEGVRLRISDTGVGFDPEMGERLFAPDYTTKARGTGLGLSVVARIIADHNWRVTARSAGKGQGAEIEIMVPGTSGDRSAASGAKA